MTPSSPDASSSARARWSIDADRLVIASGLVGSLLGLAPLDRPVERVAVGLALVLALSQRTIRRGVSGHSETTPTRALAAGLAIAGAVALLSGADARTAATSAALAGLGWMAAVFLSRRLVAALRRRGHLMTRTVVVGTGPVAVKMARTLHTQPHHGLLPVGFVDDRPPQDDVGLPLLGPTEDLPLVLLRLGVRHVLLGYGATPEHELVPVLRDLTSLPEPVEVLALPRLFELAEPSDGDVWGYPLMPVHIHRPNSTPWHLKRAFDVVVAGTMLVLATPLLAVLALAVRLDSPGPVLFRQRRVGQWGRTFHILKFRTMHHDVDASASFHADTDLTTRTGRFLRPTHLDELPQLWNVVRGEMSIVGPRPERPEFVTEFEETIPRYEDRHRVPVGITGWAQVNGLWGDTDLDDRARLDNRYIERWSLALDVRILLRTLATLTGGQADDEATTTP